MPVRLRDLERLLRRALPKTRVPTLSEMVATMKTLDLKTLREDFNDDAIFARESLMVLNKAGQLVPMIHGPAQTKLANRIKREEELGHAIRLLFLKARQVWGTVYVASRFFRRTIMQPGQHTLVLAHDAKSAKNIFDHYKRFHDNYKPFRGVIGLPKLISDRTDALEYDNGSWIKIHTAGSVNIGRSFTLHNVHFSELGFYGDHARQLIASVMAAVPTTPDTEVIGESSPAGVGTEFHTMWEAAVNGESDWIAEYFGWWEHPEYVRALAEDDTTPAAFQAVLTPEERTMRETYNLTLPQLAWRRWKIRNDLTGDEDLFKQEFSSNPQECWLTSGRPRFNSASIERMPIIRDGLTGGLQLDDIGGEKRLRFLQRERGELTIYKRPERNRQYIIGADSAQGIDILKGGGGKADPDFACAQVGDRDTGEVVARLSARLTPAEFARQLWMLGSFYNWAQLVPEINNHGWATVDALLKGDDGRIGYPVTLIYHRIRTTDQDPQERADLIGFLTTTVTRPQMISTLDEALRTGALIVHHPETQQQCRTFVIKADGKAEGAYGCHDDDVIGLALLCVGIQEMPPKIVMPLLPDALTKIDNYRRPASDLPDERGRRLKVA